jgi:hypothetical protein
MMAPLAAMLIFFFVFTLVVVRVMRTRPSEVERAARLPLGDEGGDE